MLELNEVKINRILNPTSIDLGEYVINPFMGCEFNCIYCYVRSNRVVSKKAKPWGTYVDVRINAPQLLEKEIALKRPKKVFLGSTTECFQPAENRYKITEKILRILNKNKIYYAILTRSPYITESIPLLKEGFCYRIYFTINRFSQEYKSIVEPKSPSFELRDDAVNKLLEEGLPVVPYFSPILPWISDIRGVFGKFKKADSVEFECLNFQLANISDIIKSITSKNQDLNEKYQKMLNDKIFYTQAWSAVEENIKKEAESVKKRYNIYIHNFGGYFKNTYDKV